MNTPDISVIIPIYNVERYLEECLISLVNQTYKKIELICVNDGSTDGSLKILNNFSAQYNQIKIIDKPNGGYGSAVNAGLRQAVGKYIGIVEPDDYVTDDMYSSLYEMAKQKDYPDIVRAGYWDLFDETPPRTKVQLGVKKQSGEVFNVNDYSRLLCIHPSVWSCIYRRDFLNTYNIKMIEAKGAGWVDNPFFFETSCQARRICWLNKPVYYYRQFSVNSSSILKDCSIPLCRMNEIFDFLKNKNIHNPAIIKEAYIRAFHYISMIQKNPNLNKDNIKQIYDLVNRMDRKLVKDMPDDYVGQYNQYVKKKISPPVHERIKIYLFEKYANTYFYKVLRKIYHCLRYLKNNGIISTCKRIREEITQHRLPQLPPKKGLRVLFVPSDNSRTSGAFLSMVVLNTILREQYHVDSFVVLPNSGNGEELLIKNKIPYTLIESKDWVLPISMENDAGREKIIYDKHNFNKHAIRSLRKFIKKNRFDLVHINTTYSYVGALAALSAKVPFVWHLREFLEEDQSNTLWDREKGNALINKSDAVIAISDSIYKKYSGIIDSSRLVRIYNGIDDKKFYRPEKEILQSDPVKFVFVGGFEYYKGQIEFAKACSLLKKKGYSFEIHFVGTGKKEVRDQVMSILNVAGMEDFVFYHGYSNNVNDYMNAADISFTCAKSEAFGRTTVEAMLSGNLVIGVNTAGTQELITNGVTGLLYEQGNSEDLCIKMEWALQNKEEAKAIAKAGQQYMYDNMTAQKNADNIYNLYQKILKR